MQPQPSAEPSDRARIQAIAELGRELLALGYDFVTPTPETHRRVVARRGHARDLRDVFGWSLPFLHGSGGGESVLPPQLLALMRAAGALGRNGTGQGWRSALRFSTLGGRLYAHSAFPTSGADAVFFGPDTYRFARLLDQAASGRFQRAVDIGCGSGAGGIHLAGRCAEIVLADINPAALALARANLALNGVAHALTAHSDVLAGVAGEFDLVVANPPYLADEQGRIYRDGGGELGTGLAARILDQALERLAPGGLLVLYTGAPIVAGVDLFRRAIRGRLDHVAAEVDYRELDPDVFGEELERPAYHGCERIAVVALTVRRPV